MQDVRGTATWEIVEGHFLRAFGPAFGRVSGLSDLRAVGDRVVATGSVLDGLAGRPRTVIVTVEDGEVRPLTTGAGSAHSGRPSPDGAVVAFASDRARAGVFQLYLLGQRAGEARPAPAVPGTVEYLSWAPDGAHILLGVAGLGADLSGGQGSGTTTRQTVDVPSWMPRVDTGVSEDAWRSLWVYDVAGDAVRQLSPTGLNPWEAVWCGPSSVLAVTSARPDEASWYTAVLSRLDLDGTVTEVLTSDVQMGLPSANPEGTRLALVKAVCSDRWVVAGDLHVGAPGEVEKVDTAGVDVSCTQWLDENRLGFLGVRGLETVAAIHDVTTGKTTELWSSFDTSSGLRHPEGVFLPDGRALAVVEGYRLPQQVTELASGQVLASVAHPGTDYVMSVNGTAEGVSWIAQDGLRVEGVLCLPEGEGPFPLVINIHGGPVWGFRSLWSMFYHWTPLLVARGYAVLNPNPRGSSGRGQEFARQVFGDMGGADTQDFTSAIDAMIERGIADPARIAVMGGSYGGFMSAWLATQDQRIAAAVPIAPVTNWYSQHYTSNIPFFDALFLAGDPEVPGDNFHRRSPVSFASRVTMPVLNVAGALDRCTPAGQAEEFHHAVLEHGGASTLVIYPEEGHGVRAFPTMTDFCTRVLDFFALHLGQ
ncbi:MAG: S9 family peptidase [Actinomycetota bacterium]|nr:S9 family peptidase [Actinomycetota bacterium]